jgi:hypothetical protein
MMAMPISFTCLTKRFSSMAIEVPGTDSILSRVPPVWPKPRPDILASFAPHAATRGPKASEVLSPTPPVECLSTLMPFDRGEVNGLARMFHRIGQSGDFPFVHSPPNNRHRQSAGLIIHNRAVGIAFDEETNFFVIKLPNRPVSSR